MPNNARKIAISASSGRERPRLAVRIASADPRCRWPSHTAGGQGDRQRHSEGRAAEGDRPQGVVQQVAQVVSHERERVQELLTQAGVREGHELRPPARWRSDGDAA